MALRAKSGRSGLWLLSPEKMLAEEGEDLSIKHLVESDAIETWRINADVRIALHLTGRAWSKKGEVIGVRNEMVFCVRWQSS